MKKEVLKRLVQEKAEEIIKRRPDKMESEGWLGRLYLKLNGYDNNIIAAKDYGEALIEVLAELLPE